MRFRSRGRRALLLYGSCAVAASAAAGAGYLLLTPGHSVPPGPFADDPRCAKIVSAAPETLLGRDRDRVSGAGAAAWGDASIVLRCGVEPPAPTTYLCLNVDGVDWVLDEGRADGGGARVLTTYGRTPAVEVTVEGGDGLDGGVLVALNRSLRDIPQQAKCLDMQDTAPAQPS